jgi:hypothetical protein
MDGLVENEEMAIGRAGFWYRTLSEVVRLSVAATKKKEHEVWNEIRNAKDPRTFIQAIT